MKFTLDATGKKLGRLASEAAKALIGKNSTDFTRNNVADVKVEIVNAAKLEISDKRKEETVYKNYSGYPGGLKVENMAHLIDRRGIKEVIRKTVYGMLPTNKLRSRMIKNLNITE